VTIISNPLF